MIIEIRELNKKDYSKAIQFAIKGMHLDWYLDEGYLLNLYGKYFWYLEMNRATQAMGAYVDDKFVGVLLADIKGEKKLYHSLWKTIFIKVFDTLQNLVAKDGVSSYDGANKAMFQQYTTSHAPDGEIIFLAADPDCKVKGVGTALLSEFEKREKGKEIYLYTDNTCTYQFYEHRGFARVGEKDIVVDIRDKKVPLVCLLYSKTI